MSSTKGLNDPNRKTNDTYETPQWCVNILANKLGALYRKPFALGGSLTIVDAGAGDGRIGAEVLKKFPHSDLMLVDISEPIERVIHQPISDEYPSQVVWVKHDYVKYIERLRNKLLDNKDDEENLLIVANPPFSLSFEFVSESVKLLKQEKDDRFVVCVFLLRLNWLGSVIRSKWVSANPPDRLTVLAPRPSFCVRETIDESGKKRKSSNDSCEYAWIWWETDRHPGPLVDSCIRNGYRPRGKVKNK